jgi:pimeloyl-ACP methyl ester carboxylesterase
MIDERRQFRLLYRLFLFRVIDLELLSASGEVGNLLAQFAALLAAYSFVLAVFTVSHFALSSGHSKLAVSAWGVEEFLISTTLTVTGLFAVLAWNAVLPDRRDSFVLDPFPLRIRTIFAAKGAAIATALGISIVAVNVFTGISFPFLLIPAGLGVTGAVRCLLAYWTTMAAAGVFIFVSIFALQNAAAFFSYPFFQRISGFLQLLAFFVILALFFLTPPLATPSALSASANQHLLPWLPSFWFLGLFHKLNGTEYPAFAPLAARALWSLAAVCLFTFATATLTYRRTTRRIIEQPDIAPGKSRGTLSTLAAAFALRMLSDPIDRAILLFSARTLARSRQHRLVLAFYVGTAFAISLAYAKSLMYGTSSQRWDQPSAPFLIASLVTLFFAIAGSRAVFALPFTLPANWIFRICAVRSPASYFSAVRKSLFALAAVPVLFGSAIVYLSMWPGRPALQHLLVLIFLGILLVQVSLRKFRKIPFACSYLPGKSNLRIKLGIAGFLFLLVVETGASIEHWSMQKPARYMVVLAFLLTATFWAARRTAAFAGSPYNRVQFEDAAAAEIYALDLRRDSDYANDGDYLDAVSSPPPRSFTSRMKPYAFSSVLLVAAGFSYEQLGEWRDHQRFPQVGRSVDIGGRSLNLYCSGSGSPAVVMDSGAGVPGYGWKLVEPGIAKLTRACWYDRAGYGWSDPAPRARNAADVADDLHKLLHAAGIPPPYLLVGHSLGGFHLRVFAAHYRREVAGLVLVDSADEYEDAGRLPRSMQSPAGRYLPKRLMPTVAQLMRFCIHAGLLRLFDNGVAGPDGRLSLQDTLILHALQLQPKAFDASLKEGLSRPETLAQVKAVRNLGSIPMVVLSGAKKPAVRLDDDFEMELLDRFMNYRIHVTQAHLATLSTRGRQIILENIGHGIPTEAPETIVDAVRDVLRQLAL